MADGSVIIDTELDQNGLKKGLASLGLTAVKGLKTALVGATAGLAGFGAYSYKVGSDFEAAMDKVLAISGATQEEFIQLTEKAKQMGASTKFTASESAEAFNYMAMAGWESEQMLSGIEGVMSLAAASGTDLATTSDIVTDALTAFGMKAEDSAHFANVLAAASSKANTNVSMMGETFKYVAPVAGSMGISIDDTAEAIGLMANAGIKSSMAGTTLRQVLSRLATDAGASSSKLGALGVLTKELGVEFYNTDGSVRNLNDILSEARVAWKGLTDEEQQNYAKTIAGQQGLAGWNALMNASTEDINKLRDAIATCDDEIDGFNGAAEQMAATMQDNVSGQFTILKSSAEGLGIAVYENLQNPLKEAIIEAQNYVNRLHEAFDKNGFEGLIEEAGSIFGEIAVKISEYAPKMVDAGVSFLQSFIKAIVDNSDKLLEAARKIVWTIVDGLVKLLPKEVQKPVQDTVNTIKKSFESGGLRTAIKTATAILKNLGKVITNIAKIILPPMAKAVDFLAGKTRILVPLVAAAVAAYKGYAIVKSITAFIHAHTAAVTAESLATAASTGAISLKQIAVGLLTGQITLATAAQYAWNLAMTMNPIGLVVAAVAALTAGVVALALSMDGTTSATIRLEEAQKKLDETNGKLGESYEEIGNKFNEFKDGIESSGSIFDDFNMDILISDEEKQALSDNMDAVQKEITEICSLAAEERRELTNGEIRRLEELFEEMHKLAEQELAIEQAKQGVVVTAAEDLANAAGVSLEEYEQRSKKIANTAEETRVSVIDKAESQYFEELALLKQKFDTQSDYTEEQYVKDREAAKNNYDSAVAEANKVAGDTLAIIEKGYYDKATALKNGTAVLQDLQVSEQREAKKHADNLAAIEKEYQDTIATVADKGIYDQDAAKKRFWASRKKEEDTASENARNLEEIERIHNKQVETLSDENYQNQASAFLNLEGLYETYTGKTHDSAKNIVDAFFEPMENMDSETKEKFSSVVDGAIQGLNEKENSLYWKAEQIASSFIGRFKKIFNINSPSKVFDKLFGYTMEGAEIGAEKEAKNLYKTADEISDEFKNRIVPDIDFASIASNMRRTVKKTTNDFSKVVSERSASDNYRRGEQHDKDGNHRDGSKPKYVENNIYIDGRKSARVITPYVAKELEWEGKK